MFGIHPVEQPEIEEPDPAVRGEFSPPQITGSIRTYSAIVAERLILQAGLPRPRSWPGAQRDLAREQPETAARLRSELHAWRESVSAQMMEARE